MAVPLLEPKQVGLVEVTTGSKTAGAVTFTLADLVQVLASVTVKE